MDQENEVAQSEQINNGGDDTEEEGQVLHLPINWSVIEINFIDFTCLPCFLSLPFLFYYFKLFLCCFCILCSVD